MERNDQEFSDRKKILKLVAEYADNYHRRHFFEKGDRIPYAGRVYGKEELMALVESSLEFWLTAGRYTDAFEELFCEMFQTRHCSLVNSGSSANLLAFMALTSEQLQERAISRGDEVITVAAGFPTTVAPILQYGAVPVFVDITIPEYNIDTKQMEEALSSKTKAVMVAHTLGNPFSLQAVKAFCEKHNLWLIEDNCDALGSQYTLNGTARYTGTVGDIGTSSFYPPHHITMGEGGAVYTNNPRLHAIIRSLRDWGRDCVCPSGMDDLCKHRFDRQDGDMPKGYDHKYIYSHFGYNLKATDMQAAIGVEQLKKFSAFAAARRQNFNRLYEKLAPLEELLILPKKEPAANPCWFGFMLTCKQDGLRDVLVQGLEKNNIQTRMLFAGNLTKQPCFDKMRKTGQGYRVVGDLKNTDIVMKRSFWLGVYPGMDEKMIDHMAETVCALARAK